MELHRSAGYVEFFGDLAVVVALQQQLGNLPLALAHRVELAVSVGTVSHLVPRKRRMGGPRIGPPPRRELDYVSVMPLVLQIHWPL